MQPARHALRNGFGRLFCLIRKSSLFPFPFFGYTLPPLQYRPLQSSVTEEASDCRKEARLMGRTIASGLVFGFLGIVLVSCIARNSPFVDDAGNPILSPPIPQDSNKAVIFFYRPPRLGRAAVSAPVVLSGKRELLVGRLPNSAYTWVTVAPGKYEFKTGFPSLVGQEERSTTSLSVDGGQKYYVRVLVERFSSEISSVPPETAEEDMKATQYVRPAQEHFNE